VIRRPIASGGPGGALEGMVMTAGGVLIVVAAWVWGAGQVAGRLDTGRWPPVPLSSSGSVLARLPHHWSDPRVAWPVTARAELPGPGLLYACALVLLALTVIPAAVWRLTAGSADRPFGGGSGARWACGADLRGMRLRRAQAGRLVLGRLPRRLTGSSLVATEARHSVLVIGPTQSGKTTGLAVPALLEWRGPVIATSVKDDLASSAFTWRARRGPCWIFDPTATSGLHPLARWSPLTACEDWSGAQRTAGWLVDATPARTGMADTAFWYAAAAKQLGPLLLAAHRGDTGMAVVVRWTNTADFDEPIRILELSGEDDAAVALAACAGRDERIRSSVATTLETVLAPFEDPVVARWTSAGDVGLGELLESEGTLFLCGPSHEQHRIQGLFAALVSAAVFEAVRRVNRRGCPLDPPLLLVLDEAANIAPVRDLDTLASTGAGMGIQLVTICQDLAQLAARYGPERSRTIANNHRAKLLLSGVGDLGSLDLMSGLAGEQAVREETVTQDLRDGRRTTSRATVFRRLAPTDELRRIPPGRGVLVYGHLPPVRVRLRPWFQDRQLAKRAAPGELRGLAGPAGSDPGGFARHLRVHRRPRGVEQSGVKVAPNHFE
jgi:type IV secretion system protein VirD4